MNVRKKLESRLAGIEPHLPTSQEHLYTFENVSVRNFDPPAYVVAFMFLNVLGYKNFGRAEKVWWHTFFKYRSYVFLVRDYKFGTWSLETKKGANPPNEVVQQLLAKIQSAARQSDELLEIELKKKIQSEQFWLHNRYSALRSAFDFYSSETVKAQVALQKLIDKQSRTTPDIKDFAKQLNSKSRAQTLLGHRAYPLILSFFSLLEFLLDAFFAFQRPNKSFLEFRKLFWQDRFKAVVPVPPGSDVLRHYEKLRVKTLFRNPLTHGLTNESSLLVPVAYGGLVPTSYEHLSSSVHFGHPQISETSVSQANGAFDDLLAYFKDTEPFAYYLLYVEHGFSIPIEKSHVASILAEMTDVEAFEHYLVAKSEYQDALTNRDI